ncbi:sigma-54-dependent transcriptional regulator [Thermodesulfobacteriota bacterium]
MKAKNTKLKLKNRKFFHFVEKAAFGNPFTSERDKPLQEITGITDLVGDKLKEFAIPIVRDRIQKMDLKGAANFKLYEGEDKRLVRISLLYDAFYRFRNNFDVLIQDQIESGDNPITVSFADDVLTLLEKRGFSHEEAIRYLAFFYQLRRAFFFINNTLVGQSQSMRKLRSNLWSNIFTQDPRWYENFLWDRMEDFSTFLVGETGTGKGTAAAALGRSGFIPYLEKKKQFAESFTKNFIEINLSQFPETLIESELFGHKKGAFTGAVEDHQGVFKRCRKYGAILLDEIGDISIAVQIKLLKVLENRSFTIVGGHCKERFQGRVIAATNKCLDDLRKEEKFRDDFYYRLCSDVIYVPSLREQIKEDPNSLEILLNHTLERIIGGPAANITIELKNIISRDMGPDYEWPGNVRELEQAVRRILLTKQYKGDLCDAAPIKPVQFIKDIEDGNLNAQEIMTSYCSMLYEKHGTYEKVAEITRLDRRTVKKYIMAAKKN